MDNALILIILIFPGVIAVLYVYLGLRYGPVYHAGVKLNKEQIKIIKEAHKRQKTAGLPIKPAGRPFYKKKMVSHEGLSIYENGMYAKFCVGNNGKYRFVPFHEISGLYPMKLENPLARTGGMLIGPAKWEGLQVETESYMVAVISSKKHDLGRVMEIIRSQMGGRWNQIYQPDEVLWSNMLEGDAYVHDSVRSGKYPFAPKVRRLKREEVEPSVGGKGALLLEESEVDFEKRISTYGKAASVLVIVGIILLVVGIYLFLVPSGGYFTWMWMILPLLLGILLLYVGIAVLVTKHKLKPLKIFENGLEASFSWPARTVFISFGEILRMSESKSLTEGEIYTFHTGQPGIVVSVKKDLRGLQEIVGLIESKIGRAEHVVRLELSSDEKRASRRLEYSMYAFGLIGGVVVSLVLSWNIPLINLTVELPLVTMFMVTSLTFFMSKTDKLAPRKLNVKIPLAIIIAMMVILLAGISFGDVLYASTPGDVREHIEPKPSSSDLTPGIYVDESLVLTGSVLVDIGQTLHLKNSTVQMDLSYDNEFGIWVAQGGTLILENSTIESSSSMFGYYFEIMGSANISHSTISGLWGDPDNENFDGGLEIYSDDVVIRDSAILNSTTNGLLITNSGPLIINTTIDRARDDGIEMRHSDARIMYNRISNCGWGMIVSVGSTADIDGNEISNNVYGIYVYASDPVIQNNVFNHTLNFALEYDSSSNPVMSGNTYHDNGRDVVGEDPPSFDLICNIMLIGVGIACISVVLWVHKEGLRKEKEALK
jgi:parallel beta-helix repeat protein